MTSGTQIRLSKRDHTIIAHVYRNRLSTNEVIQKLFWGDQQHNAVTKVTSRLCAHKYLAKHTLWHPRTYFTLGSRAAQDLGCSLNSTFPLGPQSLPTEYAVLMFASCGELVRERLATHELANIYPWLQREHGEPVYCHTPSLSPSVLELVRVDLGGASDHVARKCHSDIRQRCDNCQFRQLMEGGRFRLVVITGSIEKAAAIRSALEGRVWSRGIQFHLAIVPELLVLTGNFSHGP